MAVAAVGTVLGGLAGYWNAYRAVRSVNASPAPVATSAPAPADPSELNAVLVLPLRNLTGDASRGHIGEALSLAVTEDLVSEAVMPVVPPLLAEGLSRRGLTLPELAKQARVRYVLQGGVSEEGPHLRISLTLADASQGREVWSARLEGRGDQLLALQDDVTARVRTQLLPRMARESAQRASTRKGEDTRLEDLIMQERALAYRPHSLALQREAERLGREALARAPEDSRAQLAVAKALWLQVENHGHELGLDPAARARQLAEAAGWARRARSAGSESVTVEHVLSDEALSRGDVDTAQRLLEAAIERRPHDVNSHHNLATLYERTGRLEEAIERLRIAEKLPHHEPPVFAWSALARLHLMAGRPDHAASWARRAISEQPGTAGYHAVLALALAMRGDLDGARAATAQVRALDPTFRIEFDRWQPWIGREAAFDAMVRTILQPALTRSGINAP